MNLEGGLPNFKIQIPLFEANSYSHSQKMPCLLWSLKVHYTVHKSMPLDPMYPIHTSVYTVKFNITSHLFICFIYILQKHSLFWSRYVCGAYENRNCLYV